VQTYTANKLIFDERDMSWILYRCQFPGKLLFAMTIKKALEQQLEEVRVDLREAVFTHGQFYMVL
jgi:hypothetical protein